ncbi:MAG TPA: enhanced serine sensitivity protein SseB C-terminal domain-containing protein, partial [Alphaproteobacteria bacterium]|nr:enhanced serine sensitivity protein SseB C-terminal domain-containing protein [Alphaproteobacteria bacterium]
PDFANSPLPAAMLAVAHGDSPETRRVLYESMLKSWFLAPTREAVTEAPGFHDIKGDTAAIFSLEHDPAGLLVAVAFTDEEALRNWNKTISWIALQGTAFFQAVASTDAEEIVINPYELDDPASKMIRPGGRVKRWEFEELAQGNLPLIQADDDAGSQTAQSVLVTMPAQMPAPEVFDALGAAARKHSDVVALYFAQIIYPDGEPHWTVAVEFTSGSSRKHVERAMAALTKEAGTVFPQTVAGDLVLASTALGQSITTTGKKFYSAAK